MDNKSQPLYPIEDNSSSKYLRECRIAALKSAVDLYTSNKGGYIIDLNVLDKELETGGLTKEEIADMLKKINLSNYTMNYKVEPDIPAIVPIPILKLADEFYNWLIKINYK